MEFTVTGTCAYGPVGPGSDLDIVVMKPSALEIHEFLILHDIKTYRTESQEAYQDDGGFYFDLLDIRINIIVAANEDDFKNWVDKTERMRRVPPIQDRKERINYFNKEV